MTALYTLPDSAEFGGERYPHRTAWQDCVKLLILLEDEEKGEYFRWQTAVFYFYFREIPQEYMRSAMEYLSWFLTCGQPGQPGPKLMDWELDASAIVADVNAVAGREVRAGQDHWWTFLSWFHSIREGQLSSLVTVRSKLRRGKRLEQHEEEFFRAHRSQVLLRPRLTPAQQAEKRRLEQLLTRPAEALS